MHPSLILILSLVCFALSWLLLWAEKKSKAWYQDRAMLFSAGMFFGYGIIGFCWGALSFL